MSVSARSSKPVAKATAQPPKVGQPLVRADAPFNLFPVDALGPVAADTARAIEDVVQAPMAICGQSVLAVFGVAAQAHIDAKMPIGNHSTRPVGEFLLTIARSGERKSEVDLLATKPLNLHQERLSIAYQSLILDYLAAEAAGLNLPGPAGPTMLIDDFTMEGLVKLLPENQPSFAIFSDEAAKLLEGHSMSPEARMRTAASLCNLWDGKAITRVRASAPPLRMTGRRFSLHLMVQHSIAARLLGDAGMVDQGFTSRFLISDPESRIGNRPFKEPLPTSEPTLNTYTDMVLDLLDIPPVFDPNQPNALAPRAIGLSGPAKSAFINFYNDVESQIGAGGRYAPIVSLANKSAQHAVRLAAVQAWTEDPNASEISVDVFDRAVTLMRYYLAEGLRLVSAAPVTGDLELAEKALTWLQTSWPANVVSLADCYQRGPNKIRSKAVAMRVVRILEEHDWLTRVPKRNTSGGNPCRDAWTITR